MSRRGKGHFGILVAISVVFGLLHSGVPAAQSHDGNKKAKFDITRMADSEGLFETFNVTVTQPLRQALAAGTVREDTRVLVTETAAGRLALLTDQMAYHHIAQGQAAGKDWMATF